MRSLCCATPSSDASGPIPFPKLNPPHFRLAGLSAWARFSMLPEPQWPVYALSPAQWKAATQAGVETLPEQLPGACEWQLWHYNPALVPDGATGDPLSLTLSLQDEGAGGVRAHAAVLSGGRGLLFCRGGGGVFFFFGNFFAGHADQFVLIGGTAAT